MQNLPIQDVIPEILSQLKKENRLILQAPPGAGKTTMVPLALLDATWLGNKKIVMLEPRRIATRSAAARMAELLGEKVGQRVGYQIKADRCISKETKIMVVTEGILTRMLQSDPALEDVALIIFDEFHERNLHGDLALALSLQSQELLRDELKIMVMSATLNTTALYELLDHPPLLTSEGKSYEVENVYLDIKTTPPKPRELIPLVTKTILHALEVDEGSILVFLPGVKEIKSVETHLRKSIHNKNIIVAPLYGEMSKKAQDEAILPSLGSLRKIVLATNIAETSLTIQGIKVVVDSGLQRVSTFNSGSGMNTLKTITIAQDSAIQRSGRAGRLSEGKCYRLWHEHKILIKHALPEILSSDLTPMLLELANWGVEEVDELQWLDLPRESATAHAHELLEQLGALRNRQITKHGQDMLRLGTHPRLAHMIIKSTSYGLTKEATLIAALLSEKDIFRGDQRRSVDLHQRLITLQESHSSFDMDYNALKQVKLSAKNFESKVPKGSISTQVDHNKSGLLLALAYPDRIAKIRGANDVNYLLSGGKGAQLPHEDTLFGEKYLVVADLDNAQSNARIYKTVALDERTLYDYFSEQIETEKVVSWNDKMQRVEARERQRLGAIILEERTTNKISNEDIAQALMLALKEKGLSALNWSKDANSLRERVNFLNYWNNQENITTPKLETLPNFSEERLLETLDAWLLPYLDGISTFKALQKLNTHTLLLSMLTWKQQETINTLAPAKLKVPSGSNIYLNYTNPHSPTLAVRLQELFGMIETPKLMNNQVTLTIELLSPASRPMQVTKDLKSFWDNTYDEVKKELRGKYKRHYWPDDPYQAIATNKTKKRM